MVTKYVYTKKNIIIATLFVLFFSQSTLTYAQRGLRGLETKTPELETPSSYWAFIVGINKYSNLSPDKQLVAARPDAEAISSLLQSRYGFTKEKTIELYDSNATRKNIIKNFRALANKLTENDNLLIYYAGHGEYDKSLNLGGWIPSDADLEDTSSFVSNSDVQTYLKAIKARHILAIADSCFSESLMGKTRSVGSLSENAVKELYRDKSRWILTSGGLYPVPDAAKEGHSTFAYYLLRLLNRNNSPYLPVQQLAVELQPLVSNESPQTPKASPIVGIGDEGGQFIFSLSPLLYKKEEVKEEKVAVSNEIREMREQVEKMQSDLKKQAIELEEKRKKQELELENRNKKSKRGGAIFIPPTF